MSNVPEPTRWILGDKFDTVYGHQGSIEKLWQTRWKFVVRRPDHAANAVPVPTDTEPSASVHYTRTVHPPSRTTIIASTITTTTTAALLPC